MRPYTRIHVKDSNPSLVWLKKMETVHEILTRNGRPLVQSALAWLWACSKNTVPIPGFRTEGQIEENSRALERGPLTIKQYAEIEGIMGR